MRIRPKRGGPSDQRADILGIYIQHRRRVGDCAADSASAQVSLTAEAERRRQTRIDRQRTCEIRYRLLIIRQLQP